MREFLAERACHALLELGEEAAHEGDFTEAARRAEEACATPHAALEAEQVGRAYTLLLAGGHARAAGLRDEASASGLPPNVDAARARLRPKRHQIADLPNYTTRFVGPGYYRRALVGAGFRLV